jgi:5,10-methylenetetrahydromethanopterin reductase
MTAPGGRSVEFWRFGGTPQPATEMGRIARRFEELGWDGMVVGEDHGVLPDPYVTLSLAAASTTRLKLGTGVSVPIRHPLLAANAIATLHAASGGRTLFSFGRGDGGLASVGRAPLSVGEFEEYVERVQRYLRREDVPVGDTTSTLSKLFEYDPSLSAPKPPIDVSATGPRVIDVAARQADSVTFAVGADLNRLRERIERVKATRQAAGGDPATFTVGCYVPAAVATNGDRAKAREVIRGAVLRHARFSAFDGKLLDDVHAADQNAVLKAVDVTRDHGRHRPKTADFAVASVLDDEFVDRFAIVGTPEECAERFSAIIATGVDRIVVLTRVPTTDPAEENSARLAQQVFPLIR